MPPDPASDYAPAVAGTNAEASDGPPETRHRRSRTKGWVPWIVVALLAVAGAVVGAFYIFAGGTPTATVTGSFVLTDDATAASGCVGQGEDRSLGSGTSVALTGPDGKSIATTTLGSGVASGGTCTYHFKFPKTKTTLSSYAANVAHHATTTKTQSELKSNGWHFDLRYGPPTTTVAGSLDLSDIDTILAGCVGQGGYSDISEGATVVITDQNNRILGSGALDAGTAGDGVCTYHFSIPDVRQDEQQYAVEISHRGKVVNSSTALQSNGWTFALTL